MSPRLEAIARYHRGWRLVTARARRLAAAGCPGLADDLDVRASRAYLAMVNECRPELARERW